MSRTIAGWSTKKFHLARAGFYPPAERLLRQEKPGLRGEDGSDAFLKLEVETQWVQAPRGQSLASRPKSESWAEKGNPTAKRRQRVRELCD